MGLTLGVSGAYQSANVSRVVALEIFEILASLNTQK